MPRDESSASLERLRAAHASKPQPTGRPTIDAARHPDITPAERGAPPLLSAIRSLQTSAGNAAVCELMRSSAWRASNTHAPPVHQLQRQISLGDVKYTADQIKKRLAEEKPEVGKEVLTLIEKWANDRVQHVHRDLAALVLAASVALELERRQQTLKPPGQSTGQHRTGPADFPQPARSLTPTSTPPGTRPPPPKSPAPLTGLTASTAGRPDARRPPETASRESRRQLQPAEQEKRDDPAPPVPRRQPPQAPPRRWLSNDIPSDVRADLEEAYQQRQRFTNHDDLYEKWYKLSGKKKPHGQPDASGYDRLLEARMPELKKTPWSGGYKYAHTAPGASNIMPTFRIYINTTPGKTAEVLAHVPSWNLPGFLTAKVGDAELAHTARDVIVIYVKCESYDVIEAAASKNIGPYHAANSLSFVDEVPRLTKAILPGVSIGAEPSIDGARMQLPKPEDSPVPDQEVEIYSPDLALSFSTYRAQLIFEALTFAGNRDAYYERVRDNLRLAGIDAASPHLQGQPPSARILYRLGLVYQSIRTSIEMNAKKGETVKYREYDWEVTSVFSGYASLERIEQVAEPPAGSLT